MKTAIQYLEHVLTQAERELHKYNDTSYLYAFYMGRADVASTALELIANSMVGQSTIED